MLKLPTGDKFLKLLAQYYVDSYFESKLKDLSGDHPHFPILLQAQEDIRELMRRGWVTFEASGQVDIFAGIFDPVQLRDLIEKGVHIEKASGHTKFRLDQFCHLAAFIEFLYDTSVKLYSGVSDSIYWHSWVVKADGGLLETTTYERQSYMGLEIEPLEFAKCYAALFDSLLEDQAYCKENGLGTPEMLLWSAYRLSNNIPRNEKD